MEPRRAARPLPDTAVTQMSSPALRRVGSNGEAALEPTEIQRLLDEGVAAAAAYTFANSPFYGRRFAEAGLRPEQILSTDDLTRLEPTTKHDMAIHGDRLWCVPWERVVDVVTTSGTTGVPTLYPMTEADIRRLGYNEFLSFSCAGLTRDDVVLVAVTLDKCFIAGLAYYEGLRQLGAASARVGSGRFGRAARRSVRMSSTSHPRTSAAQRSTAARPWLCAAFASTSIPTVALRLARAFCSGCTAASRNASMSPNSFYMVSV